MPAIQKSDFIYSDIFCSHKNAKADLALHAKTECLKAITTRKNIPPPPTVRGSKAIPYHQHKSARPFPHTHPQHHDTSKLHTAL
ncbi:hypothetical protein BDY21DRAFT_352106 [Lineolata rhizophorae]|uniref:Uncharacterized protein n=1 Tax=Lineolata rhizophorae TaxID=578093 RepID=A0A6A6NS13_9PEZI|nr:hypothetical protein BDY21DRAFT_352106 [Lineolata rhizophorae]